MKPVLELETVDGVILVETDLLSLLFPMGRVQAERVVGKVTEWSLASVLERYKETCVNMGVGEFLLFSNCNASAKNDGLRCEHRALRPGGNFISESGHFKSRPSGGRIGALAQIPQQPEGAHANQPFGQLSEWTRCGAALLQFGHAVQLGGSESKRVQPAEKPVEPTGCRHLLQCAALEQTEQLGSER